VIVLNGPRGVGKTTVLSHLCTLLAGTVAINGDQLRAFAPPDARAHLGGGATYRAAGTLARAYGEMGAERVVFDFVFLRASHFQRFGEALPAGTHVQVFTLWAPLESVVERNEARQGAKPSAWAVRDGYREMQQNIALMGEIVDNAGSEPAMTAARIHELASRRG